MTIKQYGGVFGRNPTFNNVTIEGTLTFDGDIDINSDLTIEDNLYVLGSVGIGTDLPDGTLHVQTASAGSVTADTSADDLVVENNNHGGISILTPNSVTGAIYFGDPDDNNAGRILYNHGDDSLTFMTDALGNGGVGAMTIDSSRNVGIGTTTPSKKLSVKADGGGSQLGIDIHNGGVAAGDDAVISFEAQGSREWTMGLDRSSSSFVIAESGTLDSNQRLVIDDSGNLAIGTTTVNSKFNVASSQDALKYNEGVTVFRSTGSNKMFLNCVGGGANIVGSNSPITFNYHDQTTNSVTEAMRIVSGNLLVGKTTNSVDIVGGIIRADGLVNGCSDSNYSAIFSRNTNDGDIVLFRKDGTTVGSIGTGGGNLNIGNGTANLRFTSGSISPSGTTAGGSSDGVTDLGLSSRRFKDLHLSGGVVFGTTGGSVSSKTLDDYEEGTWTPTLYYQNATGVTRTYTEQTGHYTKIGNTVTVWCTLKGGTSNSGSYANDNMGISGLPFSVTTSATMPLRQSGFAGTASVGTLCMQVTSSVALLATPENLNNLGEDLGAGATYALSFSGSYETTA